MKNFLLKPIFIVSVIFLLMLTFSGCPTDPPPLESAIFSDVEKINISPISGTMNNPALDEFTYELPKKVKYAIVELFPPGTNFDDSEKKVPVELLIAGSRTDLDGFTRDSVKANQLYDVNSEGTDFDTAAVYARNPGPFNYIWIVLGYDENMILTHASPAGEVRIDWP